MRKIFAAVMISLLFIQGCASENSVKSEDSPITNPEEIAELPEKEIPESTLMKDSPVSPVNLDDVLFLDDCLYFDTRDVNQFIEEGHVAGFVNIPFYHVLVDYEFKENVLFTMQKVRDEEGNITANLGDPGSFFANYEESESIIRYLFPEDKKLVFISTAGVEAAYLMNLLVQLGYDPANLYNAGSFSNSMGSNIAYRTYDNAKHLVEGTNAYTVRSIFDWGELTRLSEND